MLTPKVVFQREEHESIADEIQAKQILKFTS